MRTIVVRLLPIILLAVSISSVTASQDIPEESEPSDTESAVPDALDACKLLTKSDAETALGQPVRDPRRDSSNSCFYGSESVPGDSVMIQLVDGGAEKLEFDRSRLPKSVPQTGIGSAAFAFVSPAGFVQLSFVKENQYVALMVNKRKDSNLLEATKALATRVAANLP